MTKFRFRFSIFSLLVLTTLIAIYFASRDPDLAALHMSSHSTLPMPLDPYPQIPGRFGSLNPTELPLDRVLRQQCLKFEDLSSQQQAFARQSLTEATKKSLCGFANRRSVVFGLRHKDSDWIRAGMIALSLVGNEHDFRDVYGWIGEQKGALKELNCSTEMLGEIAKISEGSAAKQLEEIRTRNSNRSISKNLIRTAAGIGYVQSDGGPFVRGAGLLETSMRVAMAIEEVDPNYHVHWFTIGSKSRPMRESIAAVGEVLGAVTFRARIDQSLAKHQSFTVNIFELSNSIMASQIQSIFDQDESLNIWVVAVFSFENKICVINTRSYLKGGVTYETKESLSRFQDRIIEELRQKPTNDRFD